jgi:WD40 repeat protein
MASLNSSEDGRARIQQARKEKGWTIEDPRWLVEASKELEPNGNWTEVGPYASGISLPTWRRFLAGKQPIKTDAFKTYCKVLGLNWEEIVDRSSPLPPPPTEDSGRANLTAILEHPNKVSSVAISPDGKILASGCHDGIIRIWSLHSGELLRSLFGHTSAVLSVTISPDGQTLASRSHGGTIRLWNLHSGELLDRLMDLQSFQAFAISPDWQTLALSNGGHTITLLNLHNRELQHTLHSPGRGRRVYSIAISPDGQTLASTEYPGTIHLWNLHTKEPLPIHSYGGYFQNPVTISPDSQILACIGHNPETKDYKTKAYMALWNLHNHKQHRVIQPSSDITSPITISNDGQILAVGCFDRTIRLWHPDSVELLRTLEGHSASVRSVVISSDGKTLASGSEDGTIRIWKL